MESMASKKKTKQNKVKESEEGQSKQKVKVKGVSELDFLVQKQLRRKQRKTSISLGGDYKTLYVQKNCCLLHMPKL